MGGNKNSAEIWYLFHSGFAVRTPRHFLVFDYYVDKPEGETRSLQTGVIEPSEIKNESVIVFSSHRHPDHYNPVIFGWSEEINNIRYILSYDIKKARGRDKTAFIRPGEPVIEPGLRVEALKSTDQGVAFIIEIDGLCIFHAGDLNWWRWEGESEAENRQMGLRYRAEIDRLIGRKIDFAFIPLDPRLEKNYLLGVDYFIRTTGCKIVFPMHFGEDYSVFDWLQSDVRNIEYRNSIKTIEKRGQKFIYNKPLSDKGI